MRSLLIIICLIIAGNLDAQSDTLNSDSTQQHSVKKAIILSAIVPGAGQIYNHRAMPKGQKKAYWKLPLIYSGLGAMGYFFISNNILQKNLKTEYNLRQEGLAGDEQWEMYDDQGILTLYNQHVNRRDLSLLGFMAIYAIQVADAGIEAHFVRFDISKDLSVQFRPSILDTGHAGVSASFNFR